MNNFVLEYPFKMIFFFNFAYIFWDLYNGTGIVIQLHFGHPDDNVTRISRYFHDNLITPFDEFRKSTWNKKRTITSNRRLGIMLSICFTKNLMKELTRHSNDTQTTYKRFWSDLLCYKLKMLIILSSDVRLRRFLFSCIFSRSIQNVVKLSLRYCFIVFTVSKA